MGSGVTRHTTIHADEHDAYPEEAIRRGGQAKEAGADAVLTYGIVVAFFVLTGHDSPFLGALVPTMGYLLSTSVLTGVKRRWCARHEAKQATPVN